MLVVPANGRVERLWSSSDLLIDCAVSCNISGSFHLLSSDVQGWLQSFVIHLENLIGWLGSFARFMRHVKSASPTVDNCTKLICVLQKLGESCFKEKISLAVILIFHVFQITWLFHHCASWKVSANFFIEAKEKQIRLVPHHHILPRVFPPSQTAGKIYIYETQNMPLWWLQ